MVIVMFLSKAEMYTKYSYGAKKFPCIAAGAIC